jgi:hypothetical protein
MRRGLVTTLVVAACGATSPHPPPGNHVAGGGDPRRQADEELRREEPLDLARPFRAPPVDHDRAIAGYLDACHAGDKPACWIAMTVAGPGAWHDAVAAVRRNCQTGDLMSCRALPEDDRGTPSSDLPGAAGRAGICDDDTACDRAALRRECDAGFAVSCVALGMSHPTEPDRDGLTTRAAGLAVAGCDASVVAECRLLLTLGSDAQTDAARDRLCTLTDNDCRADDPLDAERDCQYGAASAYTCVELGAKYLRHTFPEPVPGRGQALVDWGCPQLAKLVGHEKVEVRVPACALASHP